MIFFGAIWAKCLGGKEIISIFLADSKIVQTRLVRNLGRESAGYRTDDKRG